MSVPPPMPGGARAQAACDPAAMHAPATNDRLEMEPVLPPRRSFDMAKRASGGRLLPMGHSVETRGPLPVQRLGTAAAAEDRLEVPPGGNDRLKEHVSTAPASKRQARKRRRCIPDLDSSNSKSGSDPLVITGRKKRGNEISKRRGFRGRQLQAMDQHAMQHAGQGSDPGVSATAGSVPRAASVLVDMTNSSEGRTAKKHRADEEVVRRIEERTRELEVNAAVQASTIARLQKRLMSKQERIENLENRIHELEKEVIGDW
jgi:uncharacterized coiled-coil protein SlyX